MKKPRRVPWLLCLMMLYFQCSELGIVKWQVSVLDVVLGAESGLVLNWWTLRVGWMVGNNPTPAAQGRAPGLVRIPFNFVRVGTRLPGR
jgi:hypothetical protein